MKILLIAALFEPYRRGGAEMVAATTARVLSKTHEVTVLTVKPFDSIRSLRLQHDTAAVISGVRVERFFPLNIFSFIHIARHGTLARLFWHLFDMFNVHSYIVTRRLITQLQPDLILTHNLKGIGYTIPAALRHARHYYQHWIHTMHDLGPLFPRGVLEFGKEKSFDTSSFVVRAYGAINRVLFGSPPIVVSRSQFFLDYVASRRWFSRSMRTRFTHDVAPRCSMVATKPTGIVKFLFVGQLESYKGINVLLHAYALLRSRGLAAELHIIGSGTQCQAVITAAQEDSSVIFYNEQQDLAHVLPTMHAAVIPTLAYENTPLSLIESLAAGLPVIASDIGGVCEAFQDGEAGYVVPPGDTTALANAMERLMHADWEQLHAQALSAWRVYDAAALNHSIAALLSHSQNPQKAL